MWGGGETSWRKWEHGSKAFIPRCLDVRYMDTREYTQLRPCSQVHKKMARRRTQSLEKWQCTVKKLERPETKTSKNVRGFHQVTNRTTIHHWRVPGLPNPALIFSSVGLASWRFGITELTKWFNIFDSLLQDLSETLVYRFERKCKNAKMVKKRLKTQASLLTGNLCNTKT